MCLRGGDQLGTPGHSIPRQAAREARRQEPPRWQRTRGGIQNWQLLGEKGAQGTGGLSRRAETAAPSTREGRQAREESGKDQGRGRTLPAPPLSCFAYTRGMSPDSAPRPSPLPLPAPGALAHRRPPETLLPSGRGCHDTRRLHTHSGRAPGEPGQGALLLRVWLWIWSEHGLFKASKAAGLLLELQNGSRWKTFSARVSPGDPASPRNLSRPTPHPPPRPPALGSPPWSPRQTFGP